jgi:transposase
VRDVRVWAGLLGVDRAVVEGVRLGSEGEVIVSVRPLSRERGRCGVCRRRCAGYDQGPGRRRWRALDLGTTFVFVEAESPRVRCPAHGVVVCAVPWARHGAGHTRVFDDQVAWLATQCSKTATCALMRIAWRTVGSIVSRVWTEIDRGADRLDGLRRIGIDEISYKRGRRFLTVVVCHDTGRLVWAAPGRDRATLRGFFDALGPARSALITHVSADQADWIAAVIAERCPHAVLCADPFHVIKWATHALDLVRREAWNQARRRGHTAREGYGRLASAGDARRIQRSRYALWKNPENLTGPQREKLAWIATTDPGLHRGYLLKEGLRFVFSLDGQTGAEALDRWLSWARRSRLPPFVQLAKQITFMGTFP